MYSAVNRIFNFLYFDPDYPTSGLIITGLARGLLYNLSLLRDRSLSNSSQIDIPRVCIVSYNRRAAKQHEGKSKTHMTQNIHVMDKTYVVLSDSALGVATGYGLGGEKSQLRVPVGARFFSSQRRPDRIRGPTQPPIKWVSGALSPGVKRPGREADHSPIRAEVKNRCTYTSTPPYVFTA
jgi:hypothetical protein